MDALRQELAQALWRLSEKAFADWTGRMTEIAQTHGLTLREINTLYELSADGPLRVSEIAVRTGLSRAAASQMVERMVQQGLLERTENPADRREKLVQLSPQGRSVTQQFDQAILEQVVRMLSRVPDRKIRSLLRALGAVLKELEAGPPGG
ncbi:MAG: MarR family transcriptional regulator [Meiothermus sp.]|uniref:MarR family winged helix-turn-helix transcriptional regulator n=1 Tax=Meiothermus sp. TaxID=1955249 RepID=UPI0025ECF674|nr:MarR family transcriptional regulator [Meiothermus sp.]MCS7059474.1 MarR family transcriptional regulator [Meiothermus sp.]MCS7193862.1 MarR family transcriptional regulator [Meiothermus sp.]MCX7739956.1 MarR family transcriptional regulator [Meiothermus sp.]MDW8090191.1 MarR family transcriptional regulator [Meiothermus sp.]MDW8481493.1 MarR family transcriptional regulator [Meiothermus sp.]